MTKSERYLLEWLSRDDGQYGECYGKDLDALIAGGFAKVMGPEHLNNFIAKGNTLMHRTVTITDAGRAALKEQS